MIPIEYHYPLLTCVWEITLSCCFSCQHCGSKAGKARKNELSTEECLKVAEQLAEMGCRRVSMIGGEVFMRSDWSTIAKALTDRNVKVSIITNGYLFTDKTLSDIKNANIESVALSLDGPERIHDAFRERGSFRKVMQAMDALIKNNIWVSVISTLSSANMMYLEEMYEILKTKNIIAWQLQACSPMGNASQNTPLTKTDFKSIIGFVEEHKKTSHFVIGIADNVGYYTNSEGYLRGNTSNKHFFNGCRAGLTSIGIDSIGNVRGCESMYADSFIEGNLRNRSLYDIWNDPQAFSYNRQFTLDQLEGKCKQCKYASKCAGGCRSYNYFSNKTLYESPCCARS